MDKQLTPEEILNKHLRTSDDIWELADLKAAVLEYASQNNRNYNENLERVIRQRDALQARVVELEEKLDREHKLCFSYYKSVKEMEPKIAELERENADYEKKLDHKTWKSDEAKELLRLSERAAKSEQLNEKLTRLLREQVALNGQYDFIFYCNEKGLTPNI